MKRRTNTALVKNRSALRARGILQATLYINKEEAAFLRELGVLVGAHWTSLAHRAAKPGDVAHAALLADLLAEVPRLVAQRARAQSQCDQSQRRTSGVANQTEFEGMS